MNGTVEISAFVDHLKSNGLVIVKLSDLVGNSMAKIELKQSALMKKRDVSLKEVIDAELLPIKTKQGLRLWLENGKIKETEFFKAKNGRIRILTSAIKRLRNEN